MTDDSRFIKQTLKITIEGTWPNRNAVLWKMDMVDDDSWERVTTFVGIQEFYLEGNTSLSIMPTADGTVLARSE